MKKKINIQMLVMVGIAIILTAILSIAVFYEVFKREMADSLARYTRLLSNTIENYEVNNIETLLSGVLSIKKEMLYTITTMRHPSFRIIVTARK